MDSSAATVKMTIPHGDLETIFQRDQTSALKKSELASLVKPSFMEISKQDLSAFLVLLRSYNRSRKYFYLKMSYLEVQ